ncbi:DNA-processing protein DprA [Leucobacter sp. G161]|uniref:DNA-processing protein DprA n=1 Tax=Leucobacter sp. G161 TaxID=663704 RepID=UPI0009F84E0A|nr:DNA-processing protein DprA [Leucobacter sp. G161]
MPTLTDLARDERSARLVLSLVGTPNDEATGRLLAQVGAQDLIALADRDTAVPGMDRAEAAVWRDRIHARSGVDRVASLLAESEQFQFLIPTDDEWPASLRDLGDRAPYGLWVSGKTNLLRGDAAERVTITGSRAATGYGTFVAEEIASDLAGGDRTVIAGGAYGIEGSAHRAALTGGGNTIAVMASGVDRAYPAGHNQLFERIAQSGLIMSEVPPGISPTRQRFIDRSRIIAAISGATVIVEAGARSGTMRTAFEAKDLGRIVGAVPGPVTSAASFGTNVLLQEGTARVVTSAKDVVNLMESSIDTARAEPLNNSFSRSAAWKPRSAPAL